MNPTDEALNALQNLVNTLPTPLLDSAQRQLDVLRQSHQRTQEESHLLLEANRLLRSAQEHFSNLYQNAPAPYFIFTERGTIHSLNSAASELLRVSDALQKVPFSDFLTPESQRIFANHLQQIYTHHRRYRCELQLQPTPGTTHDAIDVTIDSAWIAHQDHEKGFCLSTCTDISNFKRLQEELEDARIHAEKASSLKSQFLANMSHEIRTPLSSVLGYVDLLRQDIQAPEQRERLEIVYRAGKHLLFLLNEIIDLSRIEHGRFSVQRTPFLPSALFDGLQELFEIAAENSHIELRFHRDYIPEPLIGDAERIRQIMVNIIGNALKFTPIQGNVDVRVFYQHERLCVRIRDTGPGIPEDQLSAIFEMFHQADGSDTRLHGGSGLGLAISQKLARLMDGLIEVESEIGKGSTFSICIPAPISNEESDDFDDASGILPAPFYSEEPGATPRILIVDDDRILQRLLGIFVNRMGYDFAIAKHGQEALTMLEASRFHLVLLDLQMPIMDGCETVRHIRTMQQFKDLPVLALTAKAIQEDLNKCIAAGCDSYITKPVVFKQLAQQIHRYLQPIPAKDPITTA